MVHHCTFWAICADNPGHQTEEFARIWHLSMPWWPSWILSMMFFLHCSCNHNSVSEQWDVTAHRQGTSNFPIWFNNSPYFPWQYCLTCISVWSDFWPLIYVANVLYWYVRRKPLYLQATQHRLAMSHLPLGYGSSRQSICCIWQFPRNLGYSIIKFG